eukprot:8707665-Lingulodinium_polyedra.AAC.1
MGSLMVCAEGSAVAATLSVLTRRFAQRCVLRVAARNRRRARCKRRRKQDTEANARLSRGGTTTVAQGHGCRQA